MSHPSLSVTDLMRRRNVSRSTIYRRVKDGTLPAYRFGPRLLRFDAVEADAAFTAVQVTTAAAGK